MPPNKLRSGVGLVTTLVLTGIAASAVAVAVAVDEPQPADLSLALLAAEDLPPDLASAGGPTHEPVFDFDTASYEANGGLQAVAQTWQKAEVLPDDPVLIVFDFRFVFPSAEAAAAYLDAAEPILSESGTGLTLQPDTPVMGEDLRHYAGSLTQGAVTIDAQNFLLRVGPVVAKVYVAGFGTTLEDARPIAEAAGARTETWFIAQLLEPQEDTSGGDRSGSAGSVSGEMRQWATSATASSQYGSDSWSAMQATGAPDVESYSDDPGAWAPGMSDGSVEWLEVGFPVAVIPSAVTVVESLGSGAVTRIEAFDADSGTWLELWSGDDPSGEEITAFSPPLADVAIATDRLRISVDTAAVAGWNEIDAVELVGRVP